MYIYGITPQSYLGNSASDGTYLVRIPIASFQALNANAFQYFAGLNTDGNPIWSANGNQKQVIFNDQIDTKYVNGYISADGTTCAGTAVAMGMVLGGAVYNSQTGRFIASAQGTAGQVAFYEAPNPWGRGRPSPIPT